MVKQLCTLVEIEKSEKELIDFNLVDEKGRKVGYYISRSIVQFVPTEKYCGYFQEAGIYYKAYTSPTRDGRIFGAYHGCLYEATREKLEAEIARKVKNSLKVYSKKFASN